jgi:hypothetical protein
MGRVHLHPAGAGLGSGLRLGLLEHRLLAHGLLVSRLLLIRLLMAACC